MLQHPGVGCAGLGWPRPPVGWLLFAVAQGAWELSPVVQPRRTQTGTPPVSLCSGVTECPWSLQCGGGATRSSSRGAVRDRSPAPRGHPTPVRTGSPFVLPQPWATAGLLPGSASVCSGHSTSVESQRASSCDGPLTQPRVLVSPGPQCGSLPCSLLWPNHVPACTWTSCLSAPQLVDTGPL